MKILTEEEMAAKLDFRRPLAAPPDEPQSMWCIPFEYGSNGKGTRISIAKAKEITAELRAAIAEAEKRELFQAFKREEARANEFGKQYSAKCDELADAQTELFELKRKKRRLAKAPNGGAK